MRFITTYYPLAVACFIYFTNEAASTTSNSRCFEHQIRGLEEKIQLFSNELSYMREEIGHLSLGISALMDHFKISGLPLIDTKHRRTRKKVESSAKLTTTLKDAANIRKGKNGSICPEDGVWIGHECFAYYEQNVNWTTARENCQSLGGDLAVPYNVTEFLAWLSTWDRLKKDAKYTIFLPAPWIGAKFGDRFFNMYGSRLYLGRAWQWINGSHLSVDDPNWSYERPKYEKQRCVSLNDISRPEGPDFKLYEELCDEKLTYICEF